MRSLLCCETAYKEHFRRILWRFAEDGISYAEIRLAMNYGFAIESGDGNNENDHAGTVQLLADVLGFDLQGQEDAGQPLAYWIPELLDMRTRIDKLGLDLPFILHAGETQDHGGDIDTNLFDAILLGTKRIGHDFSIIKHPLLMQLCKEKKIAIETCPISNEVLGLCPTTKAHHLPILLSNCVPCTINSDDPVSWGASVLSHDFYQTLMRSNNLSIPGLGVIAEWSTEHSCMNFDMQEKVYKDFEEKWFVFCQWIIDAYG
ncbi:hypothetical protein BFJ71_g1771 [Fusarium oxysporum]|nr:hypothetical protein BFJ71_g1771 [Fusarium oxysporum]